MNAPVIARRPRSSHVRFWLWWVAATTIGWFVGFWFGVFLPGNAGLFLGIGAWVGLLQWSTLQAEVETPRSGWWAVASAFGLALPLALYRLVWGEPVDPHWLIAAGGEILLSDRYTFTVGQAAQLLLAAVAGGALAGVLQARILRRVVARAWWWAPASAAGWGLGLLGRTAGFAAYSTPLPYGLQEALSELLASLLPGLLQGVLTGSVLVWLWHAPATPPSAARLPFKRWFWRVPLLAAGLLAAMGFLFLFPSRLQYGLKTPAEVQYRSKMSYWYGRGLAFSPDGTRLVTTLPDKGAVLVDLATGHPLLTIPGAFDATEGAMTDVAFSPDGALLATADAAWEGVGGTWLPIPSGPTVRLWDAATGAAVRAFPEQGVETLHIAFSPNGALLASASTVAPWSRQSPAVKLLDVASGAEVRTFPAPESGVVALAFSPDGRLLGLTWGDGTVEQWYLAAGDEHVMLKMTSPTSELEGWYSVTGAAFSPDGELVAAAWGKRIQLWDVASGALITTLDGHEGDVFRAAFSPNGLLLATASDDKTVRLWEVATGAELHTLVGHTWWVRGVAFSPDGATLASASFDGTVKLWDVATGVELRSIPWPDKP